MPDPKKPPIVWHLDTNEIGDVTNSPPDRLTMVKRLMNCYEQEGSTIKVGKILSEIRSVCKHNSNYEEADLNRFLQENCPDFDPTQEPESK